MSGSFYSTATVKRGDTFRWGDGIMRVIRRSVKDGWVDIEVEMITEGAPEFWTKRMPQGIPIGWERVPS